MQTEAFGNRIRELRELKGITQSQLADRMVVSRSTVANWEAGKRLPDIGMLARLAGCLGVETYLLMDELRGQEEPPTVIIVEDAQVILAGFVRMLGEELPEAEVCGFSTAAEALRFAHANRVAVAFVDIELGTEDGMALARELVKTDGRTNIIFLTSHAEYMADAFAEHCSGYVMKPLTPEKIRHEIAHLRFPVRGLQT